ncbi:MAG: hypothetical protein K0Q72_1510 [Armatimonadetes bacterium]|jgi:hypothetical protein|nr:hypothetical protein [Armatimonadota bacterium]
MKMQKMDPKQVPQVIGLGVISAGVFGYALFNFALGGPKPTTAVEPAPKSGAAVTSVAAAAGAAEAGTVPGAVPGAGPGGVQVVQNTPPALQLPGQYNPDPFRSSEKPEPSVVVAPKPAPAPAPEKKAPLLPPSGTAKPGPADGASQPAPAPKVVVVPAKPPRPEIVVRGTSVVEGMNLAILEIGQEHRVVQVGDVLSKGFKVKKIKLEGVEVVGDKDKFFVPVGAKSEPKKPDNAEGAAAQS